MILQPVGIRAIALNFPCTIRTNDYYRKNFPQMVAEAEQKTLARLFVTDNSTSADIWSQEVAPYMSDPFRGTVERRVVSPDETSLSLEYQAAIDVLQAAKLQPEDIDLMLVTSLFPEQVTPGNAAFLAGQLGLTSAAWNIESTCTSVLVSLQTACSLVRTGEYRNVLVVVSSTYSRYTDENDTLAFLSGDAAGAFIVGELQPNQGILGTKIANTAATCGAFYNEFTTDEQGNIRMFIRGGKGASKMFNETTVKFIRLCCHGAIAAANLTLDEIDFFAFNTPSAWYSQVCTRALGINPERTINLNPLYANIGPTFPVANLYHAAQAGKIRGGAPIRPDMLSEYDGSVVKYAVNIGGEISEHGSQSSKRATHDEARTIVTLLRPKLVKASPNIPKNSPQDDEFILFVPKVARQSKYALSVRFRYPKNTFQNSVAQPKNLPNQALMSVHPYWNFPITMGKVKFEEPVKTAIEDI